MAKKSVAERKIQAYLILSINAIDEAKAVGITVSMYMEVGTPDIFACIGGQFIAIEVKRAGERPTPIQGYQLEEWRLSGALSLCVAGMKEAQDFINFISTQSKWQQPHPK